MTHIRRKKEYQRAWSHVGISAINNDKNVYMTQRHRTVPVLDEEKTPIVLVEAEGDGDINKGDGDGYNGENKENREGADGEDDEIIQLPTTMQLEKMGDSVEDADNDNDCTQDFNDVDVNNYHNREDDEPENFVCGDFVIRNEESTMEEKLQAQCE